MPQKTDEAKRKLTQADQLLTSVLQAQRQAEDALFAEQDRESRRRGQ